MKNLKKRCLILDHDDTLMDSQYSVHYPIFLETLSMMRPNDPIPSFKEFVLLSNKYGFEGYIRAVYNFSEQEVETEITFWRTQVPLKKAKIFHEVAKVVEEFVQSNGILVVYSYSDRSMILNDYQRFFDFEPHDIIGFDNALPFRKPARAPLLKMMHAFDLKASDCLLVDDMPLLIETANRANIDMVGANWSLSSRYVWKRKHQNVVLCSDASCLSTLLFKD
jgi:beta-phosphoglucomutase-like phosphatase (HAD superfamily)